MIEPKAIEDKPLDDQIFEIMNKYAILYLSFDYGNRMVAAFDFDSELIDEAEFLESILSNIEPRD